MTHPLRYIPPDLCETDAIVSDGLRKTFRGTLKYKTPDYAILQNEKLDEIFLYNNNFISNTADIILEKEVLAHGLMSCLSQPKFILALGGIDGSLLREVLKWSCVEKVIIVHQDDEIVNSYFQKKGNSWNNGAYLDSRVVYISEFECDWLNKNNYLFDAILMDYMLCAPIGQLMILDSALKRLRQGGGLAMITGRYNTKVPYSLNEYKYFQQSFQGYCRQNPNYVSLEAKQYISSCDTESRILYFLPQEWKNTLENTYLPSGRTSFTKDGFLKNVTQLLTESK